jgi:hypothetical protein
MGEILVPMAAAPAFPALIAAAGERVGLRFLEFFAARIRNPHTRRAYARAAADFLAWCEAKAGIASLAAVQPLHVATWIEMQTREHSAPTAKLRLAALRHLFDWLVTDQVNPAIPAIPAIPANPAASAAPGTGSSISAGASCPSACATGPMGSDQRDLV